MKSIVKYVHRIRYDQVDTRSILKISEFWSDRIMPEQYIVDGHVYITKYDKWAKSSNIVERAAISIYALIYDVQALCVFEPNTYVRVWLIGTFVFCHCSTMVAVTELLQKVYGEWRIKCVVSGNNIFILATKLVWCQVVGKFRVIFVCVFTSLFMHNIFLLKIIVNMMMWFQSTEWTTFMHIHLQFTYYICWKCFRRSHLKFEIYVFVSYNQQRWHCT